MDKPSKKINEDPKKTEEKRDIVVTPTITTTPIPQTGKNPGNIGWYQFDRGGA